MIAISDLPAVNATLNATSSVFLIVGYAFIRRKRVTPHLVCMTCALVASAVFLVSYLTYHAHVGSKPFQGQGWVRPVYFTLLTSHTLLAAAVALFLAPVTVYRAWRKRFDMHKRIARWTFPVWLYVSITGIVIYWMLYHWYAPA